MLIKKWDGLDLRYITLIWHVWGIYMQNNFWCYFARLEGLNVNISIALYICIYTSSQRQHYFQALVVSVHGFQWRCVKTGGELTDGQSNEVAKGSHQRKEAYLGGGEPDPSQTEEAMELCQVHSWNQSQTTHGVTAADEATGGEHQ